MKSKRIFTVTLLVFLLISIIQEGTAQQVANTNNEQNIENKIRINELEKKVEDQQKNIAELNKSLNNQIKNIDYQSTNLDHKNNLVSWGIAIIGIVIAFFGVAVPLLALFYGKKLIDSIEAQKALASYEIKVLRSDSENNVSRFISDAEKGFKLLEEKARLCVENLKKYESEGQKSSRKLEELSHNSKIPNLTTDEIKENIQKAKEIENKDGISQFEKDFAKALELYYKDDSENAISHFNNLLRKYPKQITIHRLSDIYFMIARLYFGLENHSKSIEYDQKALDLDPNLASAWNNLGASNEKMRNTDEALRCYIKAVEINPKIATAWYNIGSIFQERGDIQSAISNYVKAIESDMEYFPPYLNLIEHYLISNKVLEAKDYLIKLKSILNKENSLIRFLEIVLDIIQNKWKKDLKETYEFIEESIVMSPEIKIWQFDVMKNWLNNEMSSVLSADKKNLISNLIAKIEDWQSNN
ncbi:MAG: hypothetical protein CVU02_02385 [Bacteroidetes bacterium HGW-Bacteroidetes-19]|nr:MAG: hypothetical protein CVU02_02385 [Bacteroidetes bacterium HGW-Bacteroidetes-19]